MTKGNAKKHTVTVPHSLWVKAGGSPMRLRELIQIGLDAEEEREELLGPKAPDSSDLAALSWHPKWKTLEYHVVCEPGHHGMQPGEEYQWATKGFREDGTKIYTHRCREHAD